MGVQTRAGGAWLSPNRCQLYVGGSWRQVISIKGYSGGAWRDLATFASPMSLSISPNPASSSGYTSTQAVNVTASPTGGLSPFTYSWALVAGSGVTALSPTSAVTDLQATGLVADSERFATFRCTATDSLGTVATADVDVDFYRAPPGGPLS